MTDITTTLVIYRYSLSGIGTTYEIEICVQKSISNLLVVSSRSSRESLDCPLRTVLYIISQCVSNKHASTMDVLYSSLLFEI